MYENNCHDVSNLYKHLDALDPLGRFWSIKPLLTYNKPFIFCTSSRSIGKSTNVACFLILDYIYNGYRWIYLRRTKDEVLETCQSFFSNAISLLNERCGLDIEEITYKGGDYYIKRKSKDKAEKCGETMALSLEHKFKSNVYNCMEYKTGTILYDEFLPKEVVQYLGSFYSNPQLEFTKFNEFYGTVDREIDNPFLSATRAIFLGNTSTLYNPFFIGLGIAGYIYKDEKAKIVSPKAKPWILNRVKQVDATKGFQNSLLYAISDESDARYNFENDGGDDYNTKFIKKCEKIDSTVIIVKLQNKTYRVLRQGSEFFVEKFNGNIYGKCYSLDFASHGVDDFQLIMHWHNDPRLAMIRTAYTRGDLYFDDNASKRAFAVYLQLVS